MYESFYGLSEKPFNLTPDPRFLYLSQKHKDAFAHLLYGIRNRNGFVMVSGEIGTGKTTICRSLLKQIDPDTEVAFIFNPYLSPEELLRKINQEFGISTSASTVRGLIDELDHYLLQQASAGKNCVLIIDEAQNLAPETLEQIRLLSNLETETQKLVQIVLIGQPELPEKLALWELRQLNQRITARYHLDALDAEETLHYIAFRLRVAGGRKKVAFTPRAISWVYKLSGGTPRVINAICDRSLLIGYTKDTRTITPHIVREAAREIQGQHHIRTHYLNLGRLLPTAGAVSLFAVAVLLVVLFTSGPLPGANGLAEWARTTATRIGESVPDAPARNQVEAVPAPSAAEEPVIETEAVDEEDALSSFEAALNTAVPPTPIPMASEETLDSEAAAVGGSSSTSTAPQGDQSIPESNDQQPAPEPEQIAKRAPEPIVEPVIKEETPPGPSAAEGASLRSALEALMAAWNVEGVSLPAIADASEMSRIAARHGLAFTALTPAVPQLAAINLPAVVRLRTPNGPRYAALLDMDEAFCRVAGGENIDRREFAASYLGSAYVLWRDPAPEQLALREYSEGLEVQKLQDRLHRLGLLADSANGVFGQPTLDAVQRLQRAAGLTPDGVAGQQTRMVLLAWGGEPGVPRLNAQAFPAVARERAGVPADFAVASVSAPKPIESAAPPEGDAIDPEESPLPASEDLLEVIDPVNTETLDTDSAAQQPRPLLNNDGVVNRPGETADDALPYVPVLPRGDQSGLAEVTPPADDNRPLIPSAGVQEARE